MSRGVMAVGAAAALVLLGGVGVVALDRADSSTAYDEQDAVADFRTQEPRAGAGSGSAPAAVPPPSSSSVPGPAAAPSPPGEPRAAGAPSSTAAPAPVAPGPGPAAAGGPAESQVPTGVYRYATQGHEEVDALGGARHDYPGTSTVTYTRSGCGTEERWQPLEERVGVAVTCRGPRGGEVRSTFQQREFFGQRQSQSYRCEPGLLVHPRDPRPGLTWSGACTSPDSTARFAGRVVALEELDVGGAPVPVVRVRLDGTLTGSTRGRSDREVWLRRGDGLLVQATGTTDTDADTPGGTVRYRETYRLRLLSLTPSR